MKSPSEIAKPIIRDYIEYIDYMGQWYGYNFKQMSYAKWTAVEILQRIDEQKSLPPLEVIGNFRDSMAEYKLLNEKNSSIFSIAMDTTDDIISQFL